MSAAIAGGEGGNGGEASGGAGGSPEGWACRAATAERVATSITLSAISAKVDKAVAVPSGVEARTMRTP